MSNQGLRIENAGGVINIYVDNERASSIASAISSDTEKKDLVKEAEEEKKHTIESPDKDVATIRMASIDKYSSPLEANVILNRWGEDMYKVSFFVRNLLIGQVLENNHFVFSTKKKAKKTFDEIVDLMNEYKNKAEKGLVHSAIISSQIHKDMMQFKGDFTQPDSDDLSYRYNNPEQMLALENGVPPGLLTYDPDHFPMHNGIVRKASKDEDLIKIARNIEDSFKVSESIKDSIKKFCQFMFVEPNEDFELATIKRTGLAQIRPLLSNYKTKDESWLKVWAESNPEKIQVALDSAYAVALQSLADKKDPSQIDIGTYDLFIFDADQTIWDSEVPAMATFPPFETIDENTIVDSKGVEIKLKPGIRRFIQLLSKLGKGIGMISKSEKEGVPFEEQPALHALKKFDILDHFNELIVIDRELPKSIFIPSNMNQKHILFIDDSNENLIDVALNTGADVVDIQDLERRASDRKWYKAAKSESLRIAGKYVSIGSDGPCLPPMDYEIEKFDIKEKNGEYFVPENKLSDWKENVWDEMEHEHLSAVSNSWYKEAKSDRYIPAKDRPKKPKDKTNLELDHKKPRHKFKNKEDADKKDNLQWIDKKKHKEKSKSEGSFEHGGKDRHQKLKNKGDYSKYQSDTAKKKIEKEKKEHGEKGFSQLQRDRVNKRWNKNKKKKSSDESWYREALFEEDKKKRQDTALELIG